MIKNYKVKINHQGSFPTPASAGHDDAYYLVVSSFECTLVRFFVRRFGQLENY